MKKRIVSLLTALILVFSGCFITTSMYVSADAVECTLSAPTVKSTKQVSFTATDTTGIPQGSTKRYEANGVDEGIYVNTVLTDLAIFKTGDNTWVIKSNDVFATDTVITVKGTFTNSGNSVKFKTITIKYNGSSWDIIENPDENLQTDRTFQLYYSGDEKQYGTAEGIFLSANDTLDHDATWNTPLSFDDGDDNGVFLNGTKTAAQMKKVSEQGWYACLSDAGVVAQTDDVITIKGSISHNGKTAIFNEASFVFNGVTWEVKLNVHSAIFTQYYADDTVKYGNSAGIYLAGTDSIETIGWGLGISFNAGDDNGVFLNNEKKNVQMKKYEDGKWFVCLGDAGITAQVGDVVTVKGAITYNLDKAVFAAISLVFDGTTWLLTDDPNLESGRTLTLDTQLNDPKLGIWLKGDDSLAAPGWETPIAADSYPTNANGVFLNGTKTQAVMKKYEGNKWYVALSDAGVTPAENDVVTIKGVFIHETYKVAFNEVEFVFNGTTWEEKTTITTLSIDFVDLLSISKFNTTTNKWEIYLSTTTLLPGADETTVFDVSMKIDGANKIVRGKKSSQEHAFAFQVDAADIPQNPESEVALTIRSGIYDVIGEDTKIKIESDAILYFISGTVSTVSSSFHIDEKDITFTLDRLMEGGGNKKGIYLTATDSVPYDVEWNLITNACQGKLNGVFLNGVKTNAFLKKFDQNKYYVDLEATNVVPQEGDIVVIKGAFKTNDYVSSYKEYILTFKEGSWVDGSEPETNYKTVEIVGLNSNVSMYNDARGRWEIYFESKDMLPGNKDQVFNFVTAKINGTDYTIPCYHSGHNDLFLLIIYPDMLPKNETAEIKISGKAKSEDHLIGMDVVPFTFYVNKYGISLDGFTKPVEIKETGATLSLDTETFNWMAGTQTGVYLLTTDKFAVDKNWGTSIRAITYDDNSGVFYNGQKIDAALKKYLDGHIYLDIAAGGVHAKNKDKITVKGTFALDGYGVTYKEINLYYNGQSWGTTYTNPLPRTTTNLKITGIKADSGYNKDRKDWVVYIKVDGEVPGERDHEFKSLVCEANGKTFDVCLYKAGDCLVFFVPESIMPADTKQGTTIKLKGGFVSDNYELYDIDLSGELTLYTFYTSISQKPPTNKTSYLDITVPGLLRACKYVEDIKAWQLFFKVEEEFQVDDGMEFFNLPVKLNGKTNSEIRVFRSGEALYMSIPESVLPKDTKTATITIDKGAKAVANSGWNGIRFKDKVEVYLFAGIWNNVKFTEYQDSELTFKHLNSCHYNSEVSRWDIYLNVDKEIPGQNWFEQFEGLTAYLNGQKFSTYASKAESGNNRLMYISIDEATFGKFKDGDVLHFPKGTVYSCGGYRIKNVQDFYLQYLNGTWFEYYKTNVKAPEPIDTIWENARIDEYIPVQEEKGIMITNAPPTNVIKSVENVKDVTFTFDTTKMLAYNEELPTNSIILRGAPLAEGMEISETALYGYNISFSYVLLTEERFPDNPELWGVHSQEIAVWKNGINYPLMDQYRMTYNWIKSDHPFFEYDKKYEYKISIYNVEEDICFIEIFCNDEMVMRVVDRGSSDELDPVYNAGQIQLYASCPQYLYSPEVELDSLQVSKSECYVGEQVRVSATYPAILEGSEYKLEGDSGDAQLKDGVFIAKTPGTYTISGTYNGVSKGTVKIKVSEKPNKQNNTEETSAFPIIPVAIGGGVAVLAAAAVLIVMFIKKKRIK